METSRDQVVAPTVKAVPAVSWFPCMMYAKNAVTDTVIGAAIHISEKQTEFTRAKATVVTQLT